MNAKFEAERITGCMISTRTTVYHKPSHFIRVCATHAGTVIPLTNTDTMEHCVSWFTTHANLFDPRSVTSSPRPRRLEFFGGDGDLV